jgi:hypothetical protein
MIRMNLGLVLVACFKLRLLKSRIRPYYVGCLLGALASFAVTPLLAQSNGSQALSKKDVIKMLDRQTSQGEIKRLALQRHIDFVVTEEVVNDLKKNHGASDDLIVALKASQPCQEPCQEPTTPNLERQSTEQPSPPQQVLPNNSGSLKKDRSGSAASGQTMPGSSNRTATILVRADLASVITVDGKDIGKLQTGETTISSVGIGQHLVQANVPGLSLVWQKTVDINKVGQVIVETELQTLLDTKISGSWKWDANHVTGDGCRFETDAWVLFAKKGGSLSEKNVVLARNASDQDQDESPRSCPTKLSSHCIRSFRLELSLPDAASGLHFDSVFDDTPVLNQVESPQSEGDEAAKRFCEQQFSLPTAGFSGTLSPVSNTLRLKVDSLNIDLALTRE